MYNAFVYILTNKFHTVLYTGVTNNLTRRIHEHRAGLAGKNSFTSKYHVNILVYYEAGDDITGAIAREKQIKGGSRRDKIRLIESTNPEWNDLSDQATG